MHNVCRVSVHTMVFTPPSNVYTKIMAKIINVVTQKGTCKSFKITFCKILTTKYNRAVAPNVLLKIKKLAPVL